MSLYQELKRRNVLRVAIAYLAGSWLLVEVAETIFPLFGFDDTPARIMVIVLAIGLWPAPLIDLMHASVEHLLTQVLQSKL